MIKNFIPSFLLGCLFLSISLPLTAETYLCHYTSDTIRIDGNLNEQAWRAAPALDFFVPPHIQKPLSPTIGKMLWDNQYLYISFKAIDKDVGGTLTRHDSSTFKEDVLEMFFMPDPDKKFYYNLEINALGTIYDALMSPHHSWREAARWNLEGLMAKVEIKGSLNNPDDRDEYWQMELAIPWQKLPELEKTPPPVGKNWTFHLARYDYSAYLPEGKELSSCAPLSLVKFHHHPDWVKMKFCR